jgi:hypothetical protein
LTAAQQLRVSGILVTRFPLSFGGVQAMRYLRISIPALVLLVGAAIFVAAQREPAHAQGHRAIAWEHKLLVVPASSREEIDSKLQKAGADGWECVSLAFPTNSISQIGYVVLKRQR